MRRAVIYLLCTIAVTCGCRTRVIEYDYHPYCEVDLEVDWSNHVETPMGMTAIFYNVNGGEPITHITHDVTKTKISLREGVYNVILFSYSPSEYGTIGFRGMDRYETAEIHALETSSKGWYSKADDEKVVSDIETIGVATIEGFEVTEEMINRQRTEAKAAAEAKAKGISPLSDEKAKVLTKAYISLSPKNIIANSLIKIHIDGINNLRSIRGTMTGLSEGFVPSQFMTISAPVTHVLDDWAISLDEDNSLNGYIQTDCSTFGLQSMQISKAEAKSNSVKGIPLSKAVETRNGESEIILNLSLLLVDNKTVIDVSYKVDQHIDVIENTREIVLELEIENAKSDPEKPDGPLLPVKPEEGDNPDEGGGCIELPDVKPDGGSSSGFDAEVSDWGEDVEIDVIL